MSTSRQLVAKLWSYGNVLRDEERLNVLTVTANLHRATRLRPSVLQKAFSEQ